MTRCAVAALAFLAAAGLPSCSNPSSPAAEDERDDAELYESNVREWVGALEAGMVRARLDLARRAIMRAIEGPG
ncbi:hypothetical protein D9599_30085 [Roseomonas sp. KE2513]|nr:hypothetical protein [Roseomonas sp. KE2513]